MANIKSAIKRARQNTKRRTHNTSRRSMMRTYIKAVLNAVEAGDLEKAKSALVAAQPIIDKAANKGLIHKNRASRIQSRLVRQVKSIAA